MPEGSLTNRSRTSHYEDTTGRTCQHETTATCWTRQYQPDRALRDNTNPAESPLRHQENQGVARRTTFLATLLMPRWDTGGTIFKTILHL